MEVLNSSLEPEISVRRMLYVMASCFLAHTNFEVIPRFGMLLLGNPSGFLFPCLFGKMDAIHLHEEPRAGS